MTTPTFEIIAEPDMLPEVIEALDRYDEEAFAGNPMAEGYVWSVAQWRIIIRWGDEIAGQLSLFERNCRVGGQEIRLGGVGSVMTRPEFRGRGLASIGMTAATEFFREHRPVNFALLVCQSHLVKFYGGMGWETVSGPVWVQHPERGVEAMQDVYPMVRPLHNAVWPGGEIELMGLPW